jgi:hypothetical protein
VIFPVCGAPRSLWGFLAALVALQNDPPNCQDLIAGQELVPIGLGQRLLDIAVGSAGYLHCDMGRHDTALDREEPFLAVFEQITVFQHRGGAPHINCRKILSGLANLPLGRGPDRRRLGPLP